MALTLIRYRIHGVRLPYARPVTWAGHAEQSVDSIILVLETEDGLMGVGEVPVRANWTGHTARSLGVALEEVFLPRLMGQNLSDAASVSRILRRIPEHAAAKTVLDIAISDLRAQAAGMPLWRWLGAASHRGSVSWTLTRGEPAAMATEAETMAGLHGFTAFKVKTGQGMERDRAVLAALCRALGSGALLLADANRAYAADEVETYTRMLAEFGVVMAEDPCDLFPDASFAQVRKAAALPVLVDHACRNLAQARLFLAAGAEVLSVKVSKSGLTESLEIAALADGRHARTHVGIGAGGALSACAAIALSAALPGGDGRFPCEETFFMQIAEDVTAAPLRVKDGVLELPDVPSLGALVDWRRVEALEI